MPLVHCPAKRLCTAACCTHCHSLTSLLGPPCNLPCSLLGVEAPGLAEMVQDCIQVGPSAQGAGPAKHSGPSSPKARLLISTLFMPAACHPLLQDSDIDNRLKLYSNIVLRCPDWRRLPGRRHCQPHAAPHAHCCCLPLFAREERVPSLLPCAPLAACLTPIAPGVRCTRPAAAAAPCMQALPRGLTRSCETSTCIGACSSAWAAVHACCMLLHACCRSPGTCSQAGHWRLLG